MRRDLGAVVALIVSATLLWGCTGEGVKKSGDVVAVINGKEVTTEDIKKRLGQAAPRMGEILADEQTRKELMDDIIATELIIEDAKKRGLDRDQEYLLRVEDFKRNELRNTYLNKEVIEKNAVSETELMDYIKKNEDAIKTEVTAGHILVKTEAEAKDVLARLAKGENFAKLAAAISLDTRNNKTGGSLGPINIRDMPAEALELEKLVLSLKVGESGILKGRFGYSVIKVASKTVNKKIAIDNELQLRLHDKLVKLKRQNALDDRAKELRSKAKVVINDEILKKAAGAPKGAEGKK
ncbi:MAG: peptidylprolyl isomerase [Nitrospirae bacterium]|nr:peptidylprolyl isomerase [Nitrospirota bacterium]